MIVRALKLFNSKYEEEYSKYVPIFVEQICGLLTTSNDDERYDDLAAEWIGYLSSVACQEWNANLFRKTQILTDIVSRILIGNIRLRESDINMYEMEGSDLTSYKIPISFSYCTFYWIGSCNRHRHQIH